MTKTKRTYTDTETGLTTHLYTSLDGSKYHLFHADGSEVSGFYISAHTGAEIKLNSGKIVFVDRGNFYHLKEEEKVTHVKYIGFSKFTKI